MDVEELEREVRAASEVAVRDEEEVEVLDSGDPGEPGDADTADALDDFLTDDGEVLPDEVQAELEALAAAELDDGTSALEAALAEAQREVARQRVLTRQAVARYREAVLAAEPELPPDLVQGDTIEEVESSVEAARRAVSQIRERVALERSRPFPVGAPARTHERAPMSAHEKIAAGLQERLI
jgi:hypothetical protein